MIDRKHSFKNINNTLSDLGWNYYLQEQLKVDSNSDLNTEIINAVLVLDRSPCSLRTFDKCTVGCLHCFQLICDCNDKYKLTDLGKII